MRDFITKAREEKGLSKAALAKLVGVHVTAIGKIERADYTGNINTLKKIADALDIEYGDFFTQL